MPILFIGESGEIRTTLEAHFRTVSDSALVTCTFDQVSSFERILAGDIHLVVIGVQCGAETALVDRILALPSVATRLPVVIFASEPTGAQVLNWLRQGASAVELWPCVPSRLKFLVDYLTVGRRSNPPRVEERPAPAEHGIGGLAYSSPLMDRLIGQIQRVAPLDVNVLLSGETGVGKTRLANLLHDHSPRRDTPFLAVNCGALPENLLESELFGHRKGAFTGADTERKGRFQEVGMGTLFLDEVDSLPMSSQCKLLRAIENRVFEPLGCNESIAFRGRIVAASNARLERLIESGQFRADLFYRLGVIDLFVPPLRKRQEDIRPIAEATLKEYAERNGLPVNSISPQVMELLETYHWPGNIRQLRNVIQSSASLCRGSQIEVKDLSGQWLADARNPVKEEFQNVMPPLVSNDAEARPEKVYARAERLSLAESRAKFEVDRIRMVLCEVGNNRTKAATRLGISRTMLYKKLAKYGLLKAI